MIRKAMRFHPEPPAMVALSRKLRQPMSPIERLLWVRLRGRRLGGFKFRRQYPVGRYVADFCCIEAKLIVELDGGTHVPRFEEDARRTAFLNDRGFRVLRFGNLDVVRRREDVLRAILLACQRPEGPSPPAPLPFRERGGRPLASSAVCKPAVSPSSRASIAPGRSPLSP